MKTQEELNAIKDELEALSEKLRELTPEEREQVTGGAAPEMNIPGSNWDTDDYNARYI